MKTSLFLTISVFLLAGFALSAPAQNTRARRPVTEAQLVKLIPALRTVSAEIRRSQSAPDTSQGYSEAYAARMALMGDIRDGKIDPLEWLTANSAYVDFPALSDYNVFTSRLASELTMRPCAVFGFGMEASELGLAKMSGDREAERKLAARGFDRSDAQEKVNAVLESMRRFYSERKFGPFDRESTFTWTAQSPDSLFTVTVMETNVYRAWGNESLPTGPILEISWNETPEDIAERRAVSLEELSDLLERAKMSERDFLDLVTALTTARRDIREPERLNIDTAFTPRTEEDKKLQEEVGQIVKVRNENARLYRRYARTLDPLLDVFDPGGQ